MRLVQAVLEAWRERSSERRALAAPKAVPDGRVSRSRLGAAVEARLAVRAGVRLDDFLRSRLARYASRLPIPLEDLPVAIDIEAGEPVVRPKIAPRSAAAVRTGPAGSDPSLAHELVRREGPYADREIRDAEQALDALDASVLATQARIETLKRTAADALASGALAARPDVVATPEQLGRPPVPPLGPIAALRGFVGALLVAEAWRFARPVLAAAGISAEGPEAAVHGAPLAASLGLVLALGAAAAAFAFAGWALARAADALDEAAGPKRRALLALAATAAALASAGAAAAATSPDRRLHLALVVTVPFAAALLWRWAASLERVRAGALDAALAWDRERAKEAVDRGRLAEALETEHAALAAFQDERARARRRLRTLHRRAVDAERQAGISARAEARRLDRFAEGIAASLELDRYLYIRLSSERDHAVVTRPVRTGRLEPALAADRLEVVG